ncbi:MAG: hypothetical protein KatS3mg059_1771 [Thermomicrobiales bacterium]|nr:MAG: hypothetical protein KatS3mg059_1771 [Thermomicrobiales bacterium]
MARYLLNSAVITAPGLYRYSLIDVEQAKRWLDGGDPPLSTIRYEQTAVALGMLIERPIEVCDLTIEMYPATKRLCSGWYCRPALPESIRKTRAACRRSCGVAIGSWVYWSG